MSRELLESIINKDYVNAQSIFESKLNDIRDQKLYEEKRRLAAQMDEVFGGMTKKEIDDRRAMGYQKASDVLGDPSKPLPRLTKRKEADQHKDLRKVFGVSKPEDENKLRQGWLEVAESGGESLPQDLPQCLPRARRKSYLKFYLSEPQNHLYLVSMSQTMSQVVLKSVELCCFVSQGRIPWSV